MTSNMNILDVVHGWFERFVVPTEEHDLYTLTLWAAHTHFLAQTDTSPRLILASALPESGKTTALEHLERLTPDSYLMANAPSAPLLARLATAHTLLVDEADMHVASGKGAHGDLFGIINAGYRRGGTYAVLEQTSSSGMWTPSRLPVFGCVALAGISPNLPPAFLSRCVFVHLSPDALGEADETIWSEMGEAADGIAERLRSWASNTQLPSLVEHPFPEGFRGRAKELYLPLMRVAAAAGGAWPDRCMGLIQQAMLDRLADRAEGVSHLPPHISLVRHIYGVWHIADPKRTGFASTTELLSALHLSAPSTWGHTQGSRPALTSHSLAQMLRKHGIRPSQLTTGRRERGYDEHAFKKVWQALDLPSPHAESLAEAP